MFGWDFGWKKEPYDNFFMWLNVSMDSIKEEFNNAFLVLFIYRTTFRISFDSTREWKKNHEKGTLSEIACGCVRMFAWCVFLSVCRSSSSSCSCRALSILSSDSAIFVSVLGDSKEKSTPSKCERSKRRRFLSVCTCTCTKGTLWWWQKEHTKSTSIVEYIFAAHSHTLRCTYTYSI